MMWQLGQAVSIFLIPFDSMKFTSSEIASLCEFESPKAFEGFEQQLSIRPSDGSCCFKAAYVACVALGNMAGSVHPGKNAVVHLFGSILSLKRKLPPSFS